MEPIKITVKDPKKAMEQATEKIVKAGGKIGKEKWSASTPLGDVSGTYLVEGNTVTINVKKKGFLLPEDTVETELRNFFVGV